MRDGEAVFEAARKLFFDPFSPSIMLDSDGSNTTAAAGVALVRGAVTLKDSQAAVIGVGPVGLRTAELLRREGAEVTMLTFPPDVFEGKHRRASGISVAQEAGFEVVEPESSDELDAALAGHVAVFAAGPAGTQILRRSGWAQADGVRGGRRLLGGRARRRGGRRSATTTWRTRTGSRSSGRWPWAVPR